MLRVVSHDLRSPLALIISARELLDSDLDEQDEESLVGRYLDIIKQSTDRMEGLLHDLLRADPSAKEHIDVEILIRRVAERVWPLAEEKQQTLNLDLNFDSRATILGDPMLLGEAVENYMTNAVKYTASGGEIKIHASVDNGRLNYVVEDNGPGIAQEHLPQLFEAYFRTPNQRGDGSKGYGIGLNLVKTIVHRHGGDVWVESTEQVGSRFGLWLPLD
jgi:signal transduction histidine kinase